MLLIHSFMVPKYSIIVKTKLTLAIPTPAIAHKRAIAGVMQAI